MKNDETAVLFEDGESQADSLYLESSLEEQAKQPSLQQAAFKIGLQSDSVIKALKQRLKEFNQGFTSCDSIVLFLDEIEHIVNTFRADSLPDLIREEEEEAQSEAHGYKKAGDEALFIKGGRF